MSIEICSDCERRVDTDYKEVTYKGKRVLCDYCADIEERSHWPTMTQINEQIEEYFK